MNDVIIRLSKEEIIRMKVIVMDCDPDNALLMMKIILERAEAAGNVGMKSHLDK